MKTHDWNFLIEWKYGLVDWFPLKYIRKSNPVELGRYSIVNYMSDYTAFSWWVKETLRRQDSIISKVK